tara:strand:- start:330 stop:551 length:222 start_codon:yes stop_codon:yes gene_type:complete
MHPLIDQGLTLALYGMGTVFVLLTLLVFAIFTMSRVLGKFEFIDENSNELSMSQKKRAAIVGAIMQHKKNKSS